MTLYIGLMSGTSMDGIDAAILDMPSNQFVYGITKPYSDSTKTRIADFLCGDNLNIAAFCQLNTVIGQEFAAAVKELLEQANLSPQDIRAIGSHGQTLEHNVDCDIPYTLQLGCGHTIAALTGIKVVADFRTRDLVNGGKGAPFAPLYHQLLFAENAQDSAIVNIGGIANISFLTLNQPVVGWDVGPGNCLMDAWIQHHLGENYDADGLWARQGVVIPSLLEQLMTDPFFTISPPKSIGKEYFSLAWLKRALSKSYRPEDVQATLLTLTATGIANAVQENSTKIKALYLCGGGTHNSLLREKIAELLPEVELNSSASIGVNPDYLEAMMFAWLAAQTIENKPVDLTSITGAKCPAILGAIYS